MKKGSMIRNLGTMLLAAALVFAPLTTAFAANNLPVAGHAGSVTVHKYLRSTDSTVPSTGKELTGAELSGLGEKAGAGIKFTLSKIDIAVTNDTTVAQAKANSTPVSEKETDSDGEIVWNNVDDSIVTGYYLLEEDAATTPAGYKAMAPAIIAVPYAVDDDEWNYDVHVYPKNVNEKELVKEEVPVTGKTGYSVGDLVEWKYIAKVDTTKLYDGTNYGTYKITDTFDTRLAFASTTSVIGIGGATNVTLDVITDYTLTTAAGSAVWELTPAGIKRLVDAQETGIEVTFKTTILDSAYTGSAVIKNGGELEWNDHAGDPQPGYLIPEGEKPSVNLYNINILKTNNDGTKTLAGAQFKIATSEANAKSGTFLKVGSADAMVTTLANGTAMFSGLPVAAAAVADTTFWLVEVTAPTTADGEYVRPGEPFTVTIKNYSGATEAEKLSATISIKNFLPGDPDIPDKWNLPLTGGMGTVIFYAVGLVVMLGAAITYMRLRKRKEIQ